MLLNFQPKFSYQQNARLHGVELKWFRRRDSKGVYDFAKIIDPHLGFFLDVPKEKALVKYLEYCKEFYSV